MLLSHLITKAAAHGSLLTHDTGDVEITGISADSRQVQPGFLFAALPGTKSDGGDFIADAIHRGAVAIIGQTAPDHIGVNFLPTATPRRELALLAAAFYQHQPGHIAAVTGTNGKTSTAFFTQQIWQKTGFQAASLGTLGLIAPGFPPSDSLTTPDPVALHQLLAKLAAARIDYLALEASSHGLDQHRLDGVTIQAAGFTNLTRDHLDYHGTMAAYGAAKARLFADRLTDDGLAIINQDGDGADIMIEAVKKRPNIRLITYGQQADDFQIIAVEPQSHGLKARLKILGRDHDVLLPVAGRFQLWNALCALGLALGRDGLEDPSRVAASVAALGQINGVKGRLERVADHESGAGIYVDYAHTPDALETILSALRPHVDKIAGGRLICLFGCGGNRDKGKRPVMGEIAARLADIAIVTDDNPRYEDPATIRREIMAACVGGIEIADRRDAIAYGAQLLRTGDILVIAGKGHEQGQIIGGETRPFDDATEARKAIRENAA